MKNLIEVLNFILQQLNLYNFINTIILDIVYRLKNIH